MHTIVCDTDFLIKIVTQPLPKVEPEFFSSNRFVTIANVERELVGLSRRDNSRVSKEAKSVLRMIRETDKIQIASLDEHRDSRSETDNLLFEFVKTDQSNRILATLDGSLLSRLEKKKLPYVTLRNNRLYFSRSERATYLSTKRIIS